MIYHLKLFQIMLIIAGAAGCTSVPAVDRKDASQLFETRVDDKWTVSYRFPTDHAGFTPLPLKEATSEGDTGTRIGGVFYPSGLFDRTIFSTLYTVNVQSYREPFTADISPSEFVTVSSLEFKRRRADRLAVGAVFVPEPPNFHIESFNNSWWACSDLIRTGKGPNISNYACRRPVIGNQVIDVTVSFAHPVEQRSEAYKIARHKVHQIATSVAYTHENTSSSKRVD